MKNNLLLFSLFLLPFLSFSQEYYKLRGYVYSENNEPLASATVRVVNSNTGTVTDTQGKYEIKLLEGLNRISVSSMAYQTEVFEVVAAKDLVKNVFLKIDHKQLDEVVVKVKKKDYSYEVIKKVIENKEAILKQYQNYKAKAYIKSVEYIEKKVVKKKEEELPPKPDEQLKLSEKAQQKNDSIPNLNIFECQLIRHQSNAGQQKEEREAVKKIGDQSTLFFKSVTDGEFNLYQNHQRVPKIGDNEITSPLSDLTFLSYRFQLIKYYFVGQDKIYQIKVMPRDLGNALYEGTIEVLEDRWVLRNVDLKLTKRGLLRYDEFGFKQEFENIQNRWVTSKITYTWKVKEGAIKKSGKTEVIHSDYEFDLNLPKRFFGDEVGLTTANAYKRDSTFWQNIRPHPLTKDELKVIKEKERLEILQNSKAYLDSIDKVYNKITFPRVLYLGIGHINRAKKTTWYFDPVLGLIDPLAIGGWRIRYGLGYYKRQENRKQVWVNTNLTYGFKNQDLRGGINLNYFYNPVKVSSINFAIGSGFNIINGAATIRDIIKRSNFYQNKFIDIRHRTELFNGFYLNTQAYYEIRSDLGDFKFGSLGDKLFNNNTPQIFPTSHVLKTGISVEYTPRQLYLREPNEKVILGSKYPTFSVSLDRAWPVTSKNSNVFTLLSAAVRQTFNVGIIGTSEYRISAGKFLDTTSLAVMDYKYMRGGDGRFFSPAMFTYQLIPKTFPVFNWYIESHYVHQFNGFFTSKIPFFNKTKIREMAGGGFLYVPERNYQYSEVFFGLNRVFKIGRERLRIGAYYVIGQSNDFGVRNGIKFSLEPYNQSKNTWSF
ncbi:DUF5686 and carboxypeptidase regulatory-like domain-containing protein [Runella sp.]|uniref:DUF5686 and carboxypeptidase regulatory-like domain-containing protein n=1 Tax=Runella sp. TaxID=1960881 RepID=UPI003D1092B3